MTVIGIDPSFRGCGISNGERHLVVKTEPLDTDANQAAAIIRRRREILHELALFINAHPEEGDDIALYLEAPAFGQASQASHLYELGWLMHGLHCMLEHLTTGEIVKVVEVSTTALRKWATGKGNTPKDGMKLAVFKRFGVEFDQDPGCDKLFAFLLCRYGQAVEAGEIDFTVSKLRGQKRRKVAKQP